MNEDIKVQIKNVDVTEEMVEEAKNLAKKIGLSSITVGSLSDLEKMIREEKANPQGTEGGMAVKLPEDISKLISELLGADSEVSAEEWAEWSAIPYNGVEGDSCDCPACNARREQEGPMPGIDATKPGLQARKNEGSFAAGDPLTADQIEVVKGEDYLAKVVDSVDYMTKMAARAGTVTVRAQDADPQVTEDWADELLKKYPQAGANAARVVDTARELIPNSDGMEKIKADFRMWTIPILELMADGKEVLMIIDAAEKIGKTDKDTRDALVIAATALLEEILIKLTGKGLYEHDMER